MRGSIRAAGTVADRIGASGAAYRPGRVIVKFRDNATPAARASALSVVRGRAALSPRAASQNFDVIDIDPALDAEEAAQAFRARPDVEYAQASYRVHAQFVPNDRLYSEQWNLPTINMETAWDIQPAAGSTITVAVLDTGHTFCNSSCVYAFVGGAVREVEAQALLGIHSISFALKPCLSRNGRDACGAPAKVLVPLTYDTISRICTSL